VYVNSWKQHLLLINKELHHLNTIFSENGFERNSFDVWPCGAMVAREIPDLKVACSIHVRVTFCQVNRRLNYFFLAKLPVCIYSDRAKSSSLAMGIWWKFLSI
jgi:hypothetical protein